ncbi:helicase, partial [Pontibacter qinzhouensis]
MDTKHYPLGSPESYIRVQTSYYKRCRQPTLLGDFTELWVPWSAETLRQDLSRQQV